MRNKLVVGLGVVVLAGCGLTVDSNSGAATGLNGAPGSGGGGAAAAAAAKACTKAHKVAVCHVPPGNPANAHTICVSKNALAAHTRHGDSAGACDSGPPCLPPPAGMVGWWTGDGDANDSIGSNNPILQRGVSFVDAVVGQGLTLAPPQPTQGVVCSASGATVPQASTIELASSAALTPQRFTIDAWVEPKAPSTNADSFGDVIFQKAHGAAHPQASYVLAWSSASERFNVGLGHTAGVPIDVLTSANTYAAGQSYHVAVTYDGADLELYVNGALDSSLAIGKPVLYSSVPATIGSNSCVFWGTNSFRTWQGVIDELELFDRALSAAEIGAIYGAGSAGKCK